MTRIAIVTTTIGVPEVLPRYLESALAAGVEARVYIVGDRKTPDLAEFAQGLGPGVRWIPHDRHDRWKTSAVLFQEAIEKGDWDKTLTRVREPLGAVASRKLKSKQYTRHLPGAPDGEYVVVQYDTVFKNKASATETVTPMRQTDGTWRVSGYYIR